jgi:hypothetical protein
MDGKGLRPGPVPEPNQLYALLVTGGGGGPRARVPPSARCTHLASVMRKNRAGPDRGCYPAFRFDRTGLFRDPTHGRVGESGNHRGTSVKPCSGGRDPENEGGQPSLGGDRPSELGKSSVLRPDLQRKLG